MVKAVAIGVVDVVVVVVVEIIVDVMVDEVAPIQVVTHSVIPSIKSVTESTFGLSGVDLVVSIMLTRLSIVSVDVVVVLWISPDFVVVDVGHVVPLKVAVGTTSVVDDFDNSAAELGMISSFQVVVW